MSIFSSSTKNNFIKLIVLEWDKDESAEKSFKMTDISNICHNIKHTSLKRDDDKTKEYKLNLELEDMFYSGRQKRSLFSSHFEKDTSFSMILMESYDDQMSFSIFDHCRVDRIETSSIKNSVESLHNSFYSGYEIYQDIVSESINVELSSSKKQIEELSYKDFLCHVESSYKLSKAVDGLIKTAMDFLTNKKLYSVSKEDIENIFFDSIGMEYWAKEDYIFSHSQIGFGKEEINYVIKKKDRDKTKISICIEPLPFDMHIREKLKSLKKDLSLSPFISRDSKMMESIMYRMFRYPENNDLKDFFIKQIEKEDDSNE